MASISAALRHRVMQRARYCCEYCLEPNELSFYPHEIDHIAAEKHGGSSDDKNLACACWRRNRYKGSDLTSFDLDTGNIVRLFNPRTQDWYEHFTLDGPRIVPLSPEARATAVLLHYNTPERVAERAAMIRKGQYPPRH